MPGVAVPGQDQRRQRDLGNRLRCGEVGRRGAAQHRGQQRLRDVDRRHGQVGQHRRRGESPHPGDERRLAVALGERRPLAVDVGLGGAALPGGRRAGEHEPVEALGVHRRRVKQGGRPHRPADPGDPGVGAQDIEEREQVTREVRPRVLALVGPAARPAVATGVVAHHPVPGPDEQADVARTHSVVHGPAAGQAVQADDERSGADVVVGDANAAHEGVHGDHSRPADPRPRRLDLSDGRPR